MRSNRLLLLLLLLAIFSKVNSDNLAGAPQTGERILLIYNALGSADYQFSEPAMETFKAALESNTSVSGVPSFTPVPSVDILNITGTSGIYSELNIKFSSQFEDSIKGGKELLHWTQVYDLRFDNVQSGREAISIDISNPTCDYSLYKSLLESGGGLFIQGEYSSFTKRNEGVTTLINLLTNDKFVSTNVLSSGETYVNIYNFPSTPENFNTDFNVLGGSTPLKLFYAGGYPSDLINEGIPLISGDIGATLNASVVLMWLSKNLKTQNGRLIVSFDINGWSDHPKSCVNEMSYATVQNFYDLFSGVQNYSVEKAFVPDTGEVGDTASFLIMYTNSGKSDLVDFTVVDTVDSCLTVLSSVPSWELKTSLGNGTTELKWTVDIAKAETDTINVKFVVDKYPGN